MLNVLRLLFRDVVEDFFIYLKLFFLFVIFYFLVPDYWFLCSVLTVVIVGGVRVYTSVKKNEK